MAIVIARDGDLAARSHPVSQEQRDALWAAFVTSWLERQEETFRTALQAEEPRTA